MKNEILLQSFAIDKDKRVRSVDEVARGLACECKCPSCGERVLARQGEVREWHFAHASGADCEGAAESALHQAAKQLLLESGGITLPEAYAHSTITLPDGRTGFGEARRPELWVDYHSAESEQAIGNIRADVVVMIGDIALCIEIAVTHFIDEEKKKSLDKLALPTIEIDLANIEREKWDWDLLQEVVVENAIHKKWMYLMGLEALEQEARDAALTSALNKPLSEVSHEAMPLPIRTRFLVDGRFVDVIERPFGLAIWSPYDPHVNELIKSLMRLIGGRWQPKFKNWLAPLVAREYLFQELRKLSGKSNEMRQ